MSELPTFTDEKLGKYLSIWDGLIAKGQKHLLDITLRADYGCFAYPLLWRYTLAYGEEKRALTISQFHRVHTWLEHIARR